jgi:hypothetical protein
MVTAALAGYKIRARRRKQSDVLLKDSQTIPALSKTSRTALPLTSDAAAGRWFFRGAHGESVTELDDSDLLEWMKSCVDPKDLRTARFRRALGQDWLTVEQASRRIREERGEIVGARAGALFASLTGLPLSLLAHGGTPVQALLLLLGLAAGGAAALVRRGPDVLPRVLIVQVLAAVAWGSAVYGLAGFAMALYLPLLFIALFAAAGSRIGGAIGRVLHARDRTRLARLTNVPASERAEDAVAA